MKIYRYKEVYLKEAALDWVQLGLDVLGFIPGFGEAFDATNAVIYAKKGDWLNATLSVISLIPEIGDLFGKGGRAVIYLQKMISKGGKAGKAAGKVLKHGPEIAKKAKGVADMVNKAIKLYKQHKSKIDPFLNSLKDSDNEDIKKHVSPHVDKIKGSLSTIESAFDNPDVQKVLSGVDKGEKAIIAERVIKSIIREEIRALIYQKN